MSNAEITTGEVIEILTAAGFDYRDFKCQVIAEHLTWAWSAGYPELTLWQSAGERTRRTSDADWDRIWKLAGVPLPEIYREAA